MMRRIWLLLLVSMLAWSGYSQTTQVSATVTDPNNNPYAMGTYSVFLTDNNGNPLSSGVVYIGNSYPVAPLSFSGSLDSTGTFSVPLAQNAMISVPNGATGTLWQFNICSMKPLQPQSQSTFYILAGPQQCLKYSTTVSGATLNLSTQLSALAPTIYFFNAQTGKCAAIGGCGGSGATPPAPAFSVPFTNSSVTNFQSDSSFNYNPTTHTLDVDNVIGNINNWSSPLTVGVSSRGSQQTVTASGSGTAITLSTAGDFSANQGVMISHAGAACGSVRSTGCASPPTPTVTTSGTTGSTTYSYALACIDGLGGYGAAGTPGSTSAGNATLAGVVSGTAPITGNYNVVTWTGNASCPEVAIYRNGSLVSTAYSYPSGTMTFNDIGLATWTNRDVPVSTPTAGANDNYVGMVSTISGTAVTLSTALGVAVSGATVYHSDTPLLQGAIAANPYVQLPPGQYLINYPINYTRVPSNPVYGISGAIQGPGTLIMDTGDIGIDVTGDDNIILRDFSMVSGGVNPTTIDLFCERDTVLHGGVAQNVLTDHLITQNAGSSNALGGRYSVGFYNYACEIQHNYDDQFQAARWVVLTSNNIDHVSSLFDTNVYYNNQSMSEVEFFSANGGGCLFGEFESAYSITWKGGYGDGGCQTAQPWAFAVDPGQVGRLTIEQFRVENKPGLISVGAASSLVEPTINTDLYRGPSFSETTAQIWLNAGSQLEDSPIILIDDYGGSGPYFAPIVDGPSGNCGVSNTQLFVGIWETVGTCGTVGAGNTIKGAGIAADWSLPPTYALEGTETSGGTWVKLGTWIPPAPGIGLTLHIAIYSGAGFSPGQNTEAKADVLIREGNGLGSAPNLNGAMVLQYGIPSITGLKVVATGGSTSPTNQSWDVYVFEDTSFGTGTYVVDKYYQDQWLNSNTPTTDPGPASTSIVVGTVESVTTGPSPVSIQSLATASITPTAITAATCSDQSFTLTGSSTSSRFGAVSPPGTLGNVSVQAINGGANSVTLHFCNPSGSNVTPPAGVYSVPVFN